MARYIDADKMLKEYQETLCFNVLCSLCPFLDNIKDDTCQVEKWINAQPTADVQPVVRGEWYLQDYYYTDELTGEKHKTKRCECSVCHKRPLYNEFGYIVYSDICPNCGADMRGGDAE